MPTLRRCGWAREAAAHGVGAGVCSLCKQFEGMSAMKRDGVLFVQL